MRRSVSATGGPRAPPAPAGSATHALRERPFNIVTCYAASEASRAAFEGAARARASAACATVAARFDPLRQVYVDPQRDVERRSVEAAEDARARGRLHAAAAGAAARARTRGGCSAPLDPITHGGGRGAAQATARAVRGGPRRGVVEGVQARQGEAQTAAAMARRHSVYEGHARMEGWAGYDVITGAPR